MLTKGDMAGRGNTIIRLQIKNMHNIGNVTAFFVPPYSTRGTSNLLCFSVCVCAHWCLRVRGELDNYLES